VRTNFWVGRRVLVTGHTGFKGGWLSIWLSMLGAEVHGYALPPEKGYSLFEVADVDRYLATSRYGDIRNPIDVTNAVRDVDPSVVFHLAAQPLVRRAHQEPIQTIETNILGTAYLLEALRKVKNIEAIVNVTTDKCYLNSSLSNGYTESDPLGGDDPYSSSKSCSELITSAYRNSFFSESRISIATARAGNVIGGGDWAEDRLVPDALRAINSSESLTVRYPDSVRPWQHVLEPLSGYLLLAQRLASGDIGFAEPWNFGPNLEDCRSVRWVLECIKSLDTGLTWHSSSSKNLPETSVLKLDITKARERLNWRPRWSLKRALRETVLWHQQWLSGDQMSSFCERQIRAYEDS
jgi:CDP-glucose 4,6-dehydratase